MSNDTPSSIADLRVALFTGNYNIVRDGPTQALNRLVGYLIDHGAAVRVYAPTIADPPFAPTGDLVSVPSLAIPGRSEYRMTFGLPPRVRRDLGELAPNIVHVASPDIAPHRAVSWARARRLPVVASVHTRFDTYPRYYNMAWLEPVLTALLRRYYRRCDALIAPSESFAQVLRDQRMNYDIGLWERGVDRTVFSPAARSTEWRRSLGVADDEVVVGFLGRLVMEKGLDVFADSIDELAARAVAPNSPRFRVVVVGEGPARAWFEARLPQAVFTGLIAGAELGMAVASMDLLFNPSVTETFGNVTLEAMACSLPVVAAQATGSESLVANGVTGRLVRPGAIRGFAEALQTYIADDQLRAAHGRAGEARASHFTWDRINQTVADTYLRLIRQRARAR